MSRLINLDDGRNVYCGHDGKYERWNIDPDTIEERPTGKWISHDDIITLVTGEISTGGVKCSVCGIKTHNKLHKMLGCPYKFCPNCGAKMIGSEERREE